MSAFINVLFPVLFFITVILGIITLVFLSGIDKYGSKKLVKSAIVFGIALVVTVPLGFLPVTFGESSQEELNAELKEDAIPVNIISNPQEDERIYVEGYVTELKKGPFDELSIIAEDGVYQIQLANTTDAIYKEGDYVRIYGTIDGLDESSGNMAIFRTVLEK